MSKKRIATVGKVVEVFAVVGGMTSSGAEIGTMNVSKNFDNIEKVVDANSVVLKTVDWLSDPRSKLTTEYNSGRNQQC